jgi:hypothetical protein
MLTPEGLLQGFLDSMGQQGVTLKYEGGKLWKGNDAEGFIQIETADLDHMLRTWLVEKRRRASPALVSHLVEKITARLAT